MKTLEVTDEQYAFIQQLREEISAQVVGRYGYVRERDAVQFLIDNLDGDLELDVDGTGDASATDDVAASVAAELDDREAIAFDEGAAGVDDGIGDGAGDDLETEDDEDVTDEDEDGAGDGEDATDEAEDEAGEADVDDGEDEAGEDDADEAGEDDADEAGEDDADDGDGSASDDDMLNRMMNLLDTHDDKWEESPSADYRYRVTLPDGTTEDVQTKDDVRALLFQHY
ncbi:hypothetical protein [Natronobeatus ordinarius]|uniref:hypothetical protein n=1 Tax=Natronobeatus ordinarius TaxID=2963433 RepID=UPI0020CEDCF5|nr:hypothetical protein [Natronobeatus ordinarius]